MDEQVAGFGNGKPALGVQVWVVSAFEATELKVFAVSAAKLSNDLSAQLYPLWGTVPDAKSAQDRIVIALERRAFLPEQSSPLVVATGFRDHLADDNNFARDRQVAKCSFWWLMPSSQSHLSIKDAAHQYGSNLRLSLPCSEFSPNK